MSFVLYSGLMIDKWIWDQEVSGPSFGCCGSTLSPRNKAFCVGFNTPLSCIMGTRMKAMGGLEIPSAPLGIERDIVVGNNMLESQSTGFVTNLYRFSAI